MCANTKKFQPLKNCYFFNAVFNKSNISQEALRVSSIQCTDTTPQLVHFVELVIKYFKIVNFV